MEKQESEEWEVVDYYVEEEGEQKWSSRMMDAGKKLVMTGVVIASAPVLLPPLLVVSALGFAMSVPFGFVFASYAATHKVMSKLLPPPLPTSSNYQQLILLEQQEEDDDEEDDDEEEEVKMQSEDIKNETEMRIGLMDYEEPIPNDDAQVIIGRDLEREEEEEVGARVTIGGDLEREEEEEEAGAQVITGRDLESRKQVVQVEKSGDGNQESSSTSADIGNENVVHVDDQMPVETKQGLILIDDDVKQGKHADGGGGGRDQVIKMAGADDSMDMKGGKHTSASLNGGSHSSPNHHQDEKIWKKIDAIRVIVGFKAPRRSSYLEEVKALYLFTGIEPPPTPSPTVSTAADLDSKLSFLMSVIGLK